MPRKKNEQRASAPPPAVTPAAGAVCIGCGCTDGRACEGGCCWILRDLCSACCLEHPLLVFQTLFGHVPAMEQLGIVGQELQEINGRIPPDRFVAFRDELYMTMHEMLRRAGPDAQPAAHAGVVFH